jgi:hypothetical protein
MVANNLGVQLKEPINLYRDMEEEDGHPILGPHNWALGVRVGRRTFDIAVDAEGSVAPSPEGARPYGMSVTPRDPANLPPRHRPLGLDGLGSYPVWCISTSQLNEALRYRPTSETHGVIEPAYRMVLTEYESALRLTRLFWRLVIASN